MTDFHMTGQTDAELKTLLANAEKQLGQVAKQNTDKLKKDEKALHAKLLGSAKPLIKSLKQDLNNGDNDEMASSIEAWRNASTADLARLSQLAGRGGLSMVAALVGYIDSIYEVVSQ
jgi:hypothetical protein